MPFKDSKEGQTHSMNDGCGEPAHNPNNSMPSPNEVLEELKTKVKSTLERLKIVDPEGGFTEALDIAFQLGRMEQYQKDEEAMRHSLTSECCARESKRCCLDIGYSALVSVSPKETP